MILTPLTNLSISKQCDVRTYKLVIVQRPYNGNILFPERIQYRRSYMVMNILWNKDGRTQKELCKIGGFEKYVLSRQISKLEKLKYVERKTDENDGRVNRVCLTALGKKIQESCFSKAMESWGRLISRGSTNRPPAFSCSDQAGIISAGRTDRIIRS